MGLNEYKYRLKMDIQRLAVLDTTQPPLYPGPVDHWMRQMVDDPDTNVKIDPLLIQTSLHSQLTPRTDFLTLKASLVLYAFSHLVTSAVFEKTLTLLALTALSGDLTSGLSTRTFFKLAKRASNARVDVKGFADMYVYGSGLPKLQVTQTFNRRRMLIELRVVQSSTSCSDSLRASPIFTVLSNEKKEL
jgi:transcription initiation factor TFIID subunit 2